MEINSKVTFELEWSIFQDPNPPTTKLKLFEKIYKCNEKFFLCWQQNTIMKLEEKMEICSLEGTLTPERSHLHIVLGREDGSAIAGHLMGKRTNYSQLLYVLGRADGSAIAGHLMGKRKYYSRLLHVLGREDGSASWVSSEIKAIYFTSWAGRRVEPLWDIELAAISPLRLGSEDG